MTQTHTAPAATTSPAPTKAPGVGLSLAALIIVASFVIPTLLDWEVYARKDPEAFGTIEPLHGFWDPNYFGPGTLPAVAIALLALVYAVPLAQRLPWRWLLVTCYLAGLAWMLSLAFTDGIPGVEHVLANRHEYFETALEIDDVPQMLDEYIARIPYAHPDNWVVHLAGHPPGAVLFFIALVRLGVTSPLWAGLITAALGATVVVPVLMTMRTLGAETAARAVAPFLALSPAGIFIAVSADGLFAAVAAWGMAALAVAATSSTRGRMAGFAVVAGLLLGYTVMMSYGLPLLGVLAIAILMAARGSWWPVPIAAAAALGVVLVFAALGFAWWEAYPVLTERYWDGLAQDRPFAYWAWGNLGALLIAAGPMIGSGVALLAVNVPPRQRRAGTAQTVSNRRVVLLLAGAAVLMILIADLSRMSKAEVERIWLPFMPWLTLSLALLPPRWVRPALAVQLGSALVVETLLYTSW
ncbi:MAG: hypothetical protein WA966_00990 [Ornithinimicrobium sp.]